jgi:drug/metabolite transporter, DME family
LRPSFRPLGGAPCILLAASLWGTTATARTFAPAAADPVAVGAARVIGGGLLLLAWAMRGGALRELAARGTGTRCVLAVGAVAAAVYQTAFFAATARAGVAVGSVVTIGGAPVFTGILSLVTGRGSRPGARWLAATVAAVAGCVMLVAGGHAAAASASGAVVARTGAGTAGVALAVVASFCYAVYATAAGHLIARGANDRAVVGAIFGGAAVLLLPVLLLSPLGWLATGRGAAVSGYLAVLTTALAYLLYARGLRTTPVTSATTLGLAEPAIAAVLGLTLLGEHLTGIGFAGLGVLGVSLVALAGTRAGPRPEGTPAGQAPSANSPARNDRAAANERASARGS